MFRPKALLVVAAVALAIALYPAHARAQAPSDPQIAGIVVAANQIDIDAGKLALKKTKNKQVRDFAQQMVNDHTSLQNSVGNLAKKLNVTPADSDTSKSLKTQAQQTTDRLKNLSGKDFDRAYIDNEIAYHQQVINANKSVLIPNAQNAELKSALQNAEPLFEGHLQHAQNVQTAMSGGGKSGSKTSK